MCVGKSEKKSLLERQRRQWIYEEETNTTQIFTFFSENEIVDIVFTRRKPIHPKTFQVGGSVVAVNLPHGNQYNQIFTFNFFSLTFREVVDWTGY